MGKALILGQGEIGIALRKVLLRAHEVHTYDPQHGAYIYCNMDNGVVSGTSSRQEIAHTKYDAIHVCFPYSIDFVDTVASYMDEFAASVWIIHSTTKPGTRTSLEWSAHSDVVHSPVIGLHPDLELSLLTFTKFVGGYDPGVTLACEHMRAAGIRVYPMYGYETTELLKVLSTTYYALMIEWAREVSQILNREDATYEAWMLWTQAYNEGYQRLGRPEFTRPLLTPPGEKIGGHCLLPNLDLIESEFADLIRRRNQ